MPHLRAAVEASLGPLYRVEREVRPVGGCRMFVAVEQPNGPELLVKVLPGELSLGLDLQVFERELLLLADRLTHAGLVPPRGVGRAAAHVYHTRPFVAGTTLRARLTRAGELPLRETVEILRGVLAALAHAHAAGVAHGDLRPENVLVMDGGTRVADAGIVTAVGRALPDGKAGERIGPGVAATLCGAAYLAPERRRDDAETTPRADMYAVGVIAHEMLMGAPPAPEEEPLEEVRSVPAWLGDLVRRCLAAKPEGRWADAGAAGAALAAGSRPSGGMRA